MEYASGFQMRLKLKVNQVVWGKRIGITGVFNPITGLKNFELNNRIDNPQCS
ncbi:hypothetical protein P872_09495 [Rhodonellum psychrophilum GCM71 = DSM 17998]|uniref:Uncharacterized protein n=1 Tax=Rhodonellum psychrophilum GCM71 = DSM 17998 TaxID=1123057 RepID=U5BUZ8_9BACT|nr:hypothetical protein P872_09495 [Rhodonellum psychrophilum GCM71 = DSM 17998]